MFADSFDHSSWAHRSRRGWSTLISFSLQALVVAALFTLPLLYTQGLPQFHFMERNLIAPLAPLPPGPVHAVSSTAGAGNVLSHPLLPIPPIPDANAIHYGEALPPPDLPPGNALFRGSGNSVIGSIGNGFDIALPPPPPPAVQTLHLSHMDEGALLHRVQPDYPILARQSRVQGMVVLSAVISREGAIEKLQVVSGHPLLVRAALEAVRQWRYRPYILNHQPIEVETQIVVNFTLSGS